MQLLELADKRPADLVALDDPRTYGDLSGVAALDEMAPRVAMLGVHTTHVFPLDPAGATGALSSIVDDAHARDLAVAAFTLRRENRFLPTQLRSSATTPRPPATWPPRCGPSRTPARTGSSPTTRPRRRCCRGPDRRPQHVRLDLTSQSVLTSRQRSSVKVRRQ